MEELFEDLMKRNYANMTVIKRYCKIANIRHPLISGHKHILTEISQSHPEYSNANRFSTNIHIN